MGVRFAPTYKTVSWLTTGATAILRVRGRVWSRTARPVIVLHGWPYTLTAPLTLDPTLTPFVAPIGEDQGAIDALVAAGRTVYRPFSGANWGTAATTSPVVGGTGLTAIEDAIVAAGADGLPTTTIDLWGTSMGATNALNWSWRNPGRCSSVYCSSPAYDLSTVYDSDAITIGWGIGAVSPILRAVHGGSNKATWSPLSQPFDPLRNTAAMAAIARKVAMFSAVDDEIVPWTPLANWCATLGIPLSASALNGVPGGGHLTAPSKPGWDDLAPLRHFDRAGP